MGQQNKKVIGILGGMGPDATITLFHRIVAQTRAERDQDHLPIIIDNNPAIPDRTRALLEGGPNPVPFLKESVQRLQKAGAEVIGMPCNTAHAFLAEIRKDLKVPFVDMVGLTQDQPGFKDRNFFLLATRGTIKAGIYSGLQIPGKSFQDRIQALIYGVKAGENLAEKQLELKRIINIIREKDGGVVLGCTELSFLYWPPYNKPLFKDDGFVIDPLNLLAQELIRAAGLN